MTTAATHPATHPATHNIGPFAYRQTERAIFRLDSLNEWVRSNICPQEFRRSAKKIGETKSEKEQLTRDERYLKDIEDAANSLRENYTADTLPGIREIRRQFDIGDLTANRAVLMIKQGITAEEARNQYKAPPAGKTRD